MKLTFKIIATLFFVGILSIGTTVFAEEVQKEYHETWKASNVESLWISNKFGNVKIKNDGGNEITIDVIVTVDARNKKRADELIKDINVSFSKNGAVVRATTKMECNCKGRHKFSINYVVNIPENKNLKIENKYGNTIVNKLTGNGDFNIQYGNFTANELTGKKIRIALAYGNSTVSKAADLTVQVKYSPMNFNEIKNLKLQSKYSDITVDKAFSVIVDSRYDKLTFEKVATVKAATKYSHLRVDELAKSLKIDAGYGSVKVTEVAKDFEEISIKNSYGQISLGLYNANYSIIASCDYCGISYPEDKFTGNKIKENNTRKIEGKIGTGEGGRVKIQSRYGEIKLRD
jgi:hypothetical protein